MARIYVSIGSNIEREPNIRAAVRALRDHFGSLTLSSVYENKPIGFEGENFYNLVAAFDTNEPPEAVNSILHDIERRLGRRRFCTTSNGDSDEGVGLRALARAPSTSTCCYMTI